MPVKVQPASERLARLLLAGWCGCLWAIGYLAVPVLFAQLGDRGLAGRLAGEMFTLVGGVGTVCGAVLILLHTCARFAFRFSQRALWALCLMWGLGLVFAWGLAPYMNHLKALAAPLEVMESAWRAEFIALHGLSSVVYLLESLCGACLLWWFSGGTSEDQD